MRPRTLAVLFVLVVGLVGFIWLVEGDLPGTDERAERAKRLLSIERGTIERLTIERGEDLIAFERRGEKYWEMVEPLPARVEANAVETLLDGLEALVKQRSFADGEAGSLGLSPPRAVVTLSGGDEERRLLIGSDVPASESMIVAEDPAGPFHVVAGDVWPEVGRPVDGWRDRQLFPFLRGEIDRLVFAEGQDRVAIAQRDGEFFLEAPLEDRVDEGTMTRFLDALEGLEVAEFIDGDRALGEGAGFTETSRALEVSGRGSDTPWRLDLGRVVEADAQDAEGLGPSIVVRAAGHVYRVPDTLSADFDRPAQQWRSLEWSGRQVHEIQRLEVRDAAGTMVLESDGGQWLRDAVKIDFNVVSDLLFAIAGTKAEALDAQGAIAGAPLFSATLDAGERQQVIEVFQPQGDVYPATVSDRQTTLWLGGDRVRDLLSKVAAVREAPRLPAENDAAAEVSVEPASPGPAAAQE